MAEPIYIDPGFDPTALAEIEGAELLQLVGGAKPASTMGFVITTTDILAVPQVPDAATYTRLQRFGWRRVLATSVAWYTWDPSAANDATFLKWVSLNVSGIAPGSITGAMLADNTITDAKIISLDYSKLIGAPANLPPSGAAGGDLTGTYPNPSVANGVITGANIANATILNVNLIDNSIAITKLAASAIGLQIPRTNVGATATEWVTKDIVNLANPASAADVGKVPTVANPYTDGYALKSPAQFIPVYHSASALPAAGATLTLNHGPLGGIPQFVSVRLKVTTNDAATGYVVGDYVAIESVHNASGNFEGMTFAVDVTATQILIVRNGAGNIFILKKSNGISTQITSDANFNLEVNAIYLA